MRLVGGIAAAVLVAVACTPGSTPRPPGSSAQSVGATFTPVGSSLPGAGAHLIVLANGVEGGVGLWALDPVAGWVTLGPTPNASAMGRVGDGAAVATGHDLDVRPRAQVGSPGRLISLTWAGTAPSAPIVALDSSPSGMLALVAADAEGLSYGLATADGAVTALTPAPVQSFAPLVAWLDDSRLLVLNTDNVQVSRLAVLDTTAHTMSTAPALGGVRVFAVSSDHQAIAAATEGAIYVGSLAAFGGQVPPPPIATVGEAQVVWALALNRTGSQIFMLSGTVAQDGRVTSIRELGYEKQGSTWTQILDSPVPFTQAVSQVYLA